MGASIASDPNSPSAIEPALTLLFRDGQRPDEAAINAALSPSNRASVVGPLSQGAAELLIDGVTFDMSGLAPADSIPPPIVDHLFDVDWLSTSSGICAIPIVPGPHLAGSARSLVVMRALMGLVRELATELPQLAAIGWAPAGSAMSAQYFERIVGAWLDGGPFPALGLTSFRESVDGGLQSSGLEYVTGQEVRMEPGVSGDRVKATQLGVRLVNQLVSFGALTNTEIVTAPDGGQLRLEPSANGRFVRVWSD